VELPRGAIGRLTCLINAESVDLRRLKRIVYRTEVCLHLRLR